MKLHRSEFCKLKYKLFIEQLITLKREKWRTTRLQGAKEHPAQNKMRKANWILGTSFWNALLEEKYKGGEGKVEDETGYWVT